MVELLKGNLKLLVLNILSNNSLHGYGLFKELEKSYNWKPSCGTLYPVLSSLEGANLIIGTETVECGRFKKIYAITDEGKVALQGMVKKFQESIQMLKLNKTF